MRTIGVRRSWQASRLKALPLLLALGVWSGPAWADAPRDIQGSQRLWLDGFDIGGTDTGNGGGLNPANGAQVTQWKDKSPNGLIAGDAVSYGATAHSFPTYVVGAGVSCNGQSNALEITNGIHPNGSITNTDIFLVTSTYEGKNAFVFSAGLVDGGSNRISSHIPWSDDTIYWDHPIVSGAGRLRLRTR